MGDGWKLADIETEEEYNFLREGQKTFCNSDSYWINGSANFEPGVTINYTNYILDNSGIVIIWYMDSVYIKFKRLDYNFQTNSG